MARLVIVAPDETPPPPPPKCRHLGCDAPGTEVTELVRGRNAWELRHCVEHQSDGVDVARCAGFLIDEPGSSPGTHLLTALPEPVSETATRKKSA